MLSLFEWFSLSSASQVRKVDALCWDLSWMHVYDSVANFVFLWWMRSVESCLGCMFMRRWQILYTCCLVDALCWHLSWMHVYERVAMGSPLHRRAIDYAWKRFLWFLPVKAWARMEFGRLR